MEKTGNIFLMTDKFYFCCIFICICFFRVHDFSTRKLPYRYGGEIYPKEMIDRHNNCLNILADTLSNEGINVLRPTLPSDPNKLIVNENGNWSVKQRMYGVCPRDLFIVTNDKFIIT